MNLNPFSWGVKREEGKKLVSIISNPPPPPTPIAQPKISSRVLHTASVMGTFDMIAVMAEIKREEIQEKLKSIFDEEELK